MTAKDEAILNMLRATRQVGLDNSAILLGVPMLGTTFTGLNNQINTITGLVSLQAALINGIAIDKLVLKNTMAQLTYNYAGTGRAWAASNNDNTTYEALDLKEYIIKRLADDLAGPSCQNVYNILNANAATLVPFGLTPAMLTEVLNAINDYMAIVPLPTNAINIRQTYTDNISDRIKDASLFLERQLDNLVRAQINAQPDFASTYFHAREIIDPPTNSTTFKVTVLQQGTNTPILGARAEVVGTEKIEYTDANGKTELKKFKKDTYTVHVSATGYSPSQQIVPIGLGETKELTFLLTVAP
jgi:hypothetical protein